MMNESDENTLHNVITDKINVYKSIIKRSYETFQEYLSKGLISSSDIVVAQNELEDIIANIDTIEKSLRETTINYNNLVEQLQTVNNKLSSIIKQNGTKQIEDMLRICYGEEFIKSNIQNNEILTEKYKVLNECSSVLNYKIVSWNLQNRTGVKGRKKNNILEDIHIAETLNTLDATDMSVESGNFILKLYGFKVIIQNEHLEQTIVLNCLMSNIPYNYLESNMFCKRKQQISENTPDSIDYNDMYKIYLSSLTLKELLVYTDDEIYDLYVGYLTNINVLKGKLLSKVTRDFMNYDLFEQRSILIQLLLNKKDNECQYISYLLYDILSTDNKNEGDSVGQSRLYNSLPACIQINFKHAMKSTIEYTSKLLDIDLEGKLPLEQRVCLMKTSDTVKEKAMTKVKELRSKSDDSGSKARSYIEGLLKIPFGIDTKEYVMNVLENVKNKMTKSTTGIELNGFEIIKYCKAINDQINESFDVGSMSKANIKNMLVKYNETYDDQLNIEFKTLKEARNELKTHTTDIAIRDKLVNVSANKNVSDIDMEIYNEYKLIKKYMKDVQDTLNDSVYGHEDAKKQVARIVGQWITGEQSGYCFGFEGPPGVGKTSLAKEGIAKCLKDKEGNSRPFGFIAIGGSSNGSTLDGHNYTYVGSMWGKIVDILMESKCMNPIIFIDEIDKVSRTETGREIIGILTHLVDPTQNDKFQDKYFSGIDLDLSKVLFIFSYNDVSLMDSILLDRIHRVQFKHLSIDEKIIITNKYILPEYAKKMGYKNFNDLVDINDDVIKYIIDTYTAEAGVRKLKEIIFEILSEINLELLNENDLVLPVELSEDLVKTKYLKKRYPITPKLIHDKPASGIINGLWANALGKGGIIQIETQLVLNANMLDMRLTGMQGDVMKESMSVARSLAWKLTSDKTKKALLKKFKDTKTQGIHIHCPEGAVPKDGPSAGTAITTCIYSLLNNIPIKNDLAITGEMNLQGNVTAIGGLDLKILGGITAGVKTFLFPKENQRDFDDFYKEWGDKDLVKGIEFYPIQTIEEALSHALVDKY